MFTKVEQKDLEGKGVVGQPTVPGLSVREMQESVEQIVREVAIPALNRLVEELAQPQAAQSIGAQTPAPVQDGQGTLQSVLEAVAEYARAHAAAADNPHGVTAAQAGAYTKQETEERINAKVTEIGTGDMAKDVYDPDADGSVVCADRLKTPRKLGSADFDGTAGVTLAQMGVPGHNLLDNTDFAHPVNQREAAGTVSAQGYFIDRWKLVSGTVRLTAEGLVLNGRIEQVLEHSAGADAAASASAGQASYSDATATFSLQASGETIRWAKLEQGGTATPWVTKGYGAELAECSRYFRRMRFDCQFYPGAAHSARVPVLLSPPMRSAPTASDDTRYTFNCEVQSFDFGSPEGGAIALSVKAAQATAYSARLALSADL